MPVSGKRRLSIAQSTSMTPSFLRSLGLFDLGSMSQSSLLKIRIHYIKNIIIPGKCIMPNRQAPQCIALTFGVTSLFYGKFDTILFEQNDNLPRMAPSIVLIIIAQRV